MYNNENFRVNLHNFFRFVVVAIFLGMLRHFKLHCSLACKYNLCICINCMHAAKHAHVHACLVLLKDKTTTNKIITYKHTNICMFTHMHAHMPHTMHTHMVLYACRHAHMHSHTPTHTQTTTIYIFKHGRSY